MMKQCKDECKDWETCGGCRECQWLLICKNAYRYIPIAEEDGTTCKGEEESERSEVKNSEE